MMATDKCTQELYENFFKQLYYYHLVADKAYANYKSNPVFLHASYMRKANDKIYELINKFVFKLPSHLILHLVELTIHYEIWMAQFDEEISEKAWRLNEEFIFQPIDSHGRYPKNDIEALLEEYEKLKEIFENV
jgi:hypothetical protein